MTDDFIFFFYNLNSVQYIVVIYMCNLINVTNVKYFSVDNIFQGKQHLAKTMEALIFGRLKWIPIPVTVGFAYIGYQQYRHIRKREERKLNTVSDPEELLANDWTVRSFVLKFMSMGSNIMSVFEIGREQYFGQVIFGFSLSTN